MAQRQGAQTESPVRTLTSSRTEHTDHGFTVSNTRGSACEPCDLETRDPKVGTCLRSVNLHPLPKNRTVTLSTGEPRHGCVSVGWGAEQAESVSEQRQQGQRRTRRASHDSQHQLPTPTQPTARHALSVWHTCCVVWTACPPYLMSTRTPAEPEPYACVICSARSVARSLCLWH